MYKYKHIFTSVCHHLFLKSRCCKQRRQQQRSNEAHNIRSTWFCFLSPHSLFPFLLLSVSLWPNELSHIQGIHVQWSEWVSEWRGCFVLRDGGATRTGSKQFSSCISMPPRSLSYFSVSTFLLLLLILLQNCDWIEWKKQTPCLTIKLVDQLPHQSITQRYTITSSMLEGQFYQPLWFYLSGAELYLETLHYVI